VPELPEVEHARRIVEALAGGKRIATAKAKADELVFPEESGAKIARALIGKRVERARRHGKWMWLELDRGPHPLVHLGMTGSWRTQGDTPQVLESSPRTIDRSWPPRFTKLSLVLEDGAEIALTDARRLGRVILRDDPRSEKPIGKLGFDPLLDMPPFARFRALALRRQRAVLKAMLLDQTFAAGVGNWIADEVLFQAKLDPRRLVGSLDDAELRRLRAKIASVIRTAVAADAVAERYPKSWLFHHRWGRNPEARTSRGEKIEHMDVAGRTTAWVPSLQSSRPAR
jgi:formamidopyrimidine-DNA glycosylase